MVNNDDQGTRIERAVARLIEDLERDHRLYTVAEKRRIMEEREQRRRKDPIQDMEVTCEGMVYPVEPVWNFDDRLDGSFAEVKALAARFQAEQ